MLKKIDILGIEVDNYTVREAMMQVENYLDNTVMNTIETIVQIFCNYFLRLSFYTFVNKLTFSDNFI